MQSFTYEKSKTQNIAACCLKTTGIEYYHNNISNKFAKILYNNSNNIVTFKNNDNLLKRMNHCVRLGLHKIVFNI